MNIVSVCNDAKKVLRSVSMSMCVSDRNKAFCKVGGNTLEYLSLCDIDHEILEIDTPVKLEVRNNKHLLVWQREFLLCSSQEEIRSLISNDLIKQIPVSAIALTLHFLFEGSRAGSMLGQNPNTGFVRYYEQRKELLPDVAAILAGQPSSVNDLPISHQILVMCIVCSFWAIALDEEGKRSSPQKPNTVPETDLIARTIPALGLEVLLFSIRNMVGLERFVDHNLDNNPIIDNALRTMSRTISGR